MKRLLATVLMAAVGSPSLAATAFPAFPKSHAEVGRWLASQTDLPTASVVLVGPGYVFSFIPPDPPPQPDGLVWKQVREEVTSMAMAGRLNGRSATATLAFDCAKGQATASDVTLYAGNSLRGEPGRSVPAAEWLTANPGLYLMDLARAACDPAFRRPFTSPPTATLASDARASVVTDPELPGPRAPAADTGAVHWVQVGAFASAAAAQQRWRAIQRQLPGQSAGKTIRIEPASAGGKSLTRALAGPFRGPAASRFCAALKAHGGDCLVR